VLSAGVRAVCGKPVSIPGFHEERENNIANLICNISSEGSRPDGRDG
jgi:hypothetical protein